MKKAPLLAIGLLGWTAFLVLFPRLSPSAGWSYAIDRQAARQRAAQTADQLGETVSESRIGVQAEERGRDSYFLSRFPDSPAAAFATPVLTSVRLEQENDGSLTVRLDRSGRVFGIEKSRPRGDNEVYFGRQVIHIGPEGTDEAPDQAVEEISLQAADRLIRGLLADWVGADAQAFEPKGKTLRNDNEVLEYNWHAASLSDENATPEATFVFRKGALAEATLDVEYADSFDDEYSDRDDSVNAFQILSVSLMILGILAGLVLYLVGSVDREIRHRQVVLSLLAIVPIYAVLFLWGSGWDEGVLDGNVALEMAVTQLLFFVFGILPLWAVIWGVGYMLAVRFQAARVVTMDLFLKGLWRSRPVGRSLGWGVLLGGAAAAAPYVSAAVIPGAEVASAETSLLSAPVPWLAALNFFAQGPFVGILFVFAYLAPLTSAYLKKRPWISGGLLLATGCIVLAAASEIAVSAWGALTCSVLIFLIASLLYRQVDLLAVIMMAFTAQAAGKAHMLLVQPAEQLQVQGFLAFAGIGLMGALAGGVAKWGRQVDMSQEISYREAIAQRALLHKRGERERLLAEFSVARKAQELMLPDKPPHIPGFQLSAACRPAREVGGDLYDFVPLEGGRWGIAVADVSGKGVPAALYMTLTKGLLRSVCEMSSQPDEIARSMNVHLHECARRKVFVTLALAVLDPSNGKALCVRAGHNPPVFRRSDNGETRFLYSSGIGLGLAGARLFDRSLTVAEVAMAPGDSLILYSDGITEAMDAQGQEFGDDRFREAIGRLDGMAALEARDLLLNEVKSFTGEIAQYDDITLVVLKRE